VQGGFFFNEFRAGEVGTGARVAEAEAIVGDDGASELLCQGGGEVTPQLDAA